MVMSAGLIGAAASSSASRSLIILASLFWIIATFLFFIHWKLGKERKS